MSSRGWSQPAINVRLSGYIVKQSRKKNDNRTMYQSTEPKLTDLTDRDYRRSTIILAALVLTALVLKGLLLSIYPIFEDEFAYLSQVYEYQRGELSTPFQNFHVHFFGWLSTVGENEVTQVIAARIVMYLLLLGTCFYLFRTARYFLCVRAALFCVLCYLCSLFTIANGASFRSDTPATFFFMFALYHFIAHEDSVFSNILAGMAMAVSLLLTIKATIYLPVFAGWFLSRLLFCGGRTKSLIRTACFLGSLILGFIILYQLHVATLSPATSLPQSVAKNSANFLSGAFSTFINFDQLFSARQWIIKTLILDALIFSLLFCGLIVHVTDLLKHRYTRNDPKAFLLILTIPLLSLLVLRYCRPYLLVFLMPTATVFCGYAFEFLVSKLKSAKRITVPVFSVALGLIVLSNFIVAFPRFIRYEEQITRIQRDILAAIHTMFPDPVPYVDRFSMVPSYPKVGFFMSEAGMRNYLQRAEPIMGRLLTEKKPLFLLENSTILDLNSSEPPRAFGSEGLLEADWTALRSYFIHHSGPVWIVGKQFDLGPAPDLRHFEIIAPGLYTVESQTDIFIDDTLYRNADVVRLKEGAHTVGAGGIITTIRLRWGDHLYRPDIEQEGGYLGAPFL